MTRGRLVLFVEGEGDVEAAHFLVKRLLVEYGAFDAITLDEHPFRVGEYAKISRGDFADWRRKLQAAAKRKDFRGCLLILDGDAKVKVHGLPFLRNARGTSARRSGVQGRAGRFFSVAVVFACMEFESWLIAGARSLANKALSDGRREFPERIEDIPSDIEAAPRDAKGWFAGRMKTGYKPARDQLELTRLVDLNEIREKKMRSFRRLESALQGVVDSIRSGEHTATPRSGA